MVVFEVALTITGDDQEFIVISQIMANNIGESGHYLLLRRKIRTLLELEVSYSSGESQVAVDSTEINKAASCSDASLFA